MQTARNRKAKRAEKCCSQQCGQHGLQFVRHCKDAAALPQDAHWKEVKLCKKKFVLPCESTVDLPFSYVNERHIPVIFYSYTIDGKEYTDDMYRDAEAIPRFYQLLKDGKHPSTSQINTFSYLEFFEQQLQTGDLLHIAFGSGMTQSVRNAALAAEKLRGKYPKRKITVIDSLCTSSGYGILVDYAADMRDKGCSLKETEQWLLHNRRNIHHEFFSTELEHYRRSGRVSGAAATGGNRSRNLSNHAAG